MDMVMMAVLALFIPSLCFFATGSLYVQLTCVGKCRRGLNTECTIHVDNVRQDIHNLSIETSECHVLLAHVQVCTVFRS